jgi:SAM-dependent methyltransferase
MDWIGWMERWDRQQEGYIGNREERFDVLIEAIAHATGDEPRVLDLCCGPGSLSARLLERLPLATVVAVDADPTLQVLGQKVYGDAGGRLTWVNQDIADPEWERIIGRLGPFDAVASTTALHYLKASTLTAVYEVVWRLLRPGGVFVDGDHLFEAGTSPRMRSLHRTLRVRASDPREEFGPWWAAFQAEAGNDAELAAAFDARAMIGTGHPETEAEVILQFHEAALHNAGFAEVGTVWQRGDDRVLVALRE